MIGACVWAFLPVIAVMAILTGCQPARLVGRAPPGGQVLRINLQVGIGYAPLLVMQSQRLLERRVPGLAVEWKAISQPDLVYDALAHGGLDVAIASPTAFLLGRERGMAARLLAGVAELPIAVVSNRTEVRGLRDLGVRDRVALPSIDSQEHTLLRMAALRELGDAHALDRLLVPRAHADGLLALLARRDVTAQVTVPPYLDHALDSPTARRLVDGAEVVGGFNPYLVAFTTPAARDARPELFEAFVETLREAGALSARDPATTARLVSDGHEPWQSVAALTRSLGRSGVVFSTRVRGLSRIAEFLRQDRHLEQTGVTWGDLTFEDVQGW